MSINQDLERVSRDAQTVMLLTIFATSAVSEPDFDKGSYFIKLEGSLDKMEKAKKPFDKDLLEMARIAIAAIKNP
ncbi:hypothetical protein [Pseudomonas sp. NPDC089741]|uniref:hypothetical protein n=1 Tax=Pseudomonas sp. NPDC089741 TaxID=3364470 RepID=UPI00381067DB